MEKDKPSNDHSANGSSNPGLTLIDYLVFLVKRKVLLLKIFIIALFSIYILVFFLIQEQFEATALIIPREEEVSAATGNLLRGIKGIPLGLGSKSGNSEMGLYNTIIFSRGMMEDVITKFDLLRIYGIDTSSNDFLERAIKRLRKEIQTKETEESAFEITVRAGLPKTASDMTNYLIQRMNAKIVELKFSRSRENRIFLEQRIVEVSDQLRLAEDSLRAFQERTGMLDAKVQLQGILTAHATLETELAAQKFKKSILERLYDKESQEVKEAEMQIQEYQKNLNILRSRSDPGSSLLPLSKLPETSVEFLRRLREVELNNLLMEYVVPLFEQAKIEEKKDFPILQVIDYAVPPAKKSYPPRVLFSLLGAFSVTMLTYLILLIRESAKSILDPRLLSLLHEAKQWKWKPGKQIE